jgi:hypothetical protein
MSSVLSSTEMNETYVHQMMKSIVLTESFVSALGLTIQWFKQNSQVKSFRSAICAVRRVRMIDAIIALFPTSVNGMKRCERQLTNYSSQAALTRLSSTSVQSVDCTL